MKRIIRKAIAVWIIFIMAVQIFPVDIKAEEASELNWEISVVKLEHTSISFLLENVEKAQDATVIIESVNYANGDKTPVKMEFPFSITESTQNISLKVTDGKYIPAGEYDVYVKDKDGNETKKAAGYCSRHGYFLSCHACPSWVEFENIYDVTVNVSVKLGFEEKTIQIAPKSTGKLEYEQMNIGDVISYTCGDGYECDEDLTAIVSNYISYLPQSLHALKDAVSSDLGNLSKEERLVAEVEGVKYYSEYGFGDRNYHNCFECIKYPKVKDSTKTIKVWVESKNGSVSEEKELQIETCPLDRCEKKVTVRPARATGKVMPNFYGNKITKVSVMISGNEYSTNVNEDGNFSIDYPYQENETKINLIYSDRHGCQCGTEEKVYNALQYKDNVINAFLNKSFAEVNEGQRIAIKIGDKIYYSKYGTQRETVIVKYPMQNKSQRAQKWFEKEDTSRSKIIEDELSCRGYSISAIAKANSIVGQVEESRNYKVFVVAGGKEYECETKLMEKDGDEDDREEYKPSDDPDYEKYMNDPQEYEFGKGNFYVEFSCKYPVQKVGSQIRVIVKDTEGYVVSDSFVIKNIKLKIKVNKVDTSTTRITGSTVGGSKVNITAGKKKYNGKAKANGNYSIKVKSMKPGTKVTVNIVTPLGYTGYKNTKVQRTSGSVEVTNYVFRTSNKMKIKISGGDKGDKLIVNIGGSQYTKKLKSNKKTMKLSLKIRKASAGSEIKVTLYDKFKKKKDSISDMVYYANDISKGMSEKNTALTTWGSPTMKNDWGRGRLQWVFTYGSSTLYAYIIGGKIVSIQRINY